MNAEEREKFYDEEIAPALLELAKKCLDNGLSMVAAVEWDKERPEDDGWGSTVGLQKEGEVGLPLAMQAMLVRSGRNIDAFILGLKRYAHRNGIDTSQSVYLHPFAPFGDQP